MQTGSRIGQYEIGERIGSGGMGEVYLAHDPRLERQVALKILIDEVGGDEERINRFIREAKAASALNHPNILTVFEIGSLEGSHFIVTEYIKGETLRERMNVGQTSLDEALGIALQAAAALGAAHEAGIIHRDIKPENIMIRADGLVKVLDFGLAKLTEKRTETASPEDATKPLFNTEPGMVMGTLAYMSPEQARGRQLDARSDIFSLGIVLYELFAGRRPFYGEGHLDLISAILKDEPTGLREISPGLPRQLERIVDKTLRKDRENRYQNVKDLEIDLEDLRDELRYEAKLNKTAGQNLPAQITSAVEQRPTLTESISTTRRFTLLHALIFAVVTAGLFGAGWLYRSGSGSAAIPGSYKVTEIANWSSAPGELFSNARFSPDGKMIAFSSTKTGSKNIWVTQTTSTAAIQVTNDAFSNTDPIWSPKGDEIAFFSQKRIASDGTLNVTGVWRVSALGGGTPTSVGPISDGSSVLRRWTESGKIYYQSNGNLYYLDTGSGTSEKVTSLDPKGGSISWVNISADEKSIAYIVQNEAGWQLFVSDAANSNPTKFSEGSGPVEGVAWLPEKKRVFYGNTVDGVYQIFVKDTATSQPVRITSSETDSIVVDAAADGSSIIFSSAKEESNLWRVTVADALETPLIRDLNSKIWPASSPDNERMVFQSVKNISRGKNITESAILVMPLKLGSEGASPSLIAQKGVLPAWSPDGSAIAFLRNNANNVELLTVNPNGGGEKRLAVGGIPSVSYSASPYNHVQANAFAWSPNSSRIAYLSNRNGASNIWAVSARDGTDETLTENTDRNVTFYCPVWSADGKKLAVLTQKRNPDENGRTIMGLQVLDLEARKLIPVFDTEKVIRLVGWTADESGLIFAETEKRFSGLPPETVLKRAAVNNGSEMALSKLKNAYYYNVFLSADRKNIAFAARNQDKDDIWMISAAGSEPRKLTNNNDSGLNFSRLAWLHDGSAIVFGKQTRFSLLSMINDIK